jgi:transposase-like protein
MMRDGTFKGRQFAADIILWAVRWYLMFPISYRDLEMMLADRGVEVDHTTIFRWIQAYAEDLEKRLRPHLRPTNGSWRVDETYVKAKGRWVYLYRAVDSRGQTIDFLLSARRDAAAAKRFFRKALAQPHTANPRTITVDRNPAYPRAAGEMKSDGELWRFPSCARSSTSTTSSSRITGGSSGWCAPGSASVVCEPRDGRWLATKRWRWSERGRFTTLADPTCKLRRPSSLVCLTSLHDHRRPASRLRLAIDIATDPRKVHSRARGRLERL